MSPNNFPESILEKYLMTAEFTFKLHQSFHFFSITLPKKIYNKNIKKKCIYKSVKTTNCKFSNYLPRNLACVPFQKDRRKKIAKKLEKESERVEAGCIGSIDKLRYTLDNASRFIILAGGADKLDSPIAEAHLFYFIYLWHDQGSAIAVIFAVCDLERLLVI